MANVVLKFQVGCRKRLVEAKFSRPDIGVGLIQANFFASTYHNEDLWPKATLGILFV